jgi:hypothetical protein
LDRTENTGDIPAVPVLFSRVSSSNSFVVQYLSASDPSPMNRQSHRRPPPPTISFSALDPDAAPLDSVTIASHAKEEAARAARPMHRQRGLKERKRASLALALEHASALQWRRRVRRNSPEAGANLNVTPTLHPCPWWRRFHPRYAMTTLMPGIFHIMTMVTKRMKI